MTPFSFPLHSKYTPLTIIYLPVLIVDLSSLNEQQQHAAVQSHREQGLGPGQGRQGLGQIRPTDTRIPSHGMWNNIITGGGNVMTGRTT